ncbi:hypothetical protein [Luteimonas sp. MC1895]|uniref:hypothetical protein n=1 Tax=Luteimonas sp. MC1895 TaxID=2819513 RepID=UPI0018F090DA|nr:hypothetical protein [Luteimonas sp. MC1895]MBJ6979130.1 hypothetical protein [Luteimonas sp. MC1895]
MSIERTQSSASEAARAREGTAETRERAPAGREQADRFRDALDGARQGVQSQPQQAQATAGEGATEEPGQQQTVTRDAVHAARDGDRGGGHGQDGSDGEAKLLDPALLWQAQHALRGGGEATPAMPAPTGASHAVAELIERHVRRLAAGGSATGADGDGRVLLRMSDATLPGTDLLLSREGNGWVLRADVRSRDSYDAIRDAAPGLTRRFAERNLGELRVEPHFHG